ncbi:hypothetical protein ACWCRI_38705, partial [Streptomyces collinus]
DDLRNTTWRTDLRPSDGRVLALPLLLRAGRTRGSVEVTRGASAGLLRRVLRGARRLLGAVRGRTGRTTTTRRA